MTEKIYFDTDCISAFLWVKREDIPVKLFGGRIVLPTQVYNELRKVPGLRIRADTLKDAGGASVEGMKTGSEEYADYYGMTSAPKEGRRIIGRGEASCIAMAKHRGGIVASNNLRDVSVYVGEYKIGHITTGDILSHAFAAGLLSEAEGNAIWSEMRAKRRMLPAETFSTYLKITS